MPGASSGQVLGLRRRHPPPSSGQCWCSVMGFEAMGLVEFAETCFEHFNLEILSNALKLAHPWLAPCFNHHALTLDSSTHGGRCVFMRKNIARVVCAHHKHSKMALCATRSPWPRSVITRPRSSMNRTPPALPYCNAFLRCHYIPFVLSPSTPCQGTEASTKLQGVKLNVIISLPKPSHRHPSSRLWAAHSSLTEITLHKRRRLEKRVTHPTHRGRSLTPFRVEVLRRHLVEQCWGPGRRT